MKIPGSKATTRWLWMISTALMLTAGAAILYCAAPGRKVFASQEKKSGRASAGGKSPSLNDQTDLTFTVYNSIIPLVGDFQHFLFPSGSFRLNSLTFPATV